MLNLESCLLHSVLDAFLLSRISDFAGHRARSIKLGNWTLIHLLKSSNPCMLPLHLIFTTAILETVGSEFSSFMKELLRCRHLMLQKYFVTGYQICVVEHIQFTIFVVTFFYKLIDAPQNKERPEGDVKLSGCSVPLICVPDSDRSEKEQTT